MTPREKLIAARELISDPARWTKGAFARNKAGQVVFPWWSGDGYAEREAVCWCAVGALQKVENDCLDGYDSAKGNLWDPDAISALRERAGRGVVEFNDSSSHGEVLSLFDQAIAGLE